MIAELNERGLNSEVTDIEILLKTRLPSQFTFDTQATPTQKPILPTHCPSCGAAIKPDVVEWLDDVTAECGYCGSPVLEENK